MHFAGNFPDSAVSVMGHISAASFRHVFCRTHSREFGVKKMTFGPVNICVSNHYGLGIGIQDFVDLIRYELGELGIPVVVTQNLITDGVNIVIEEFSNIQFRTALLNSFETNDPRLVLVATEVVRDGIFDSVGSTDRLLQNGHYSSGSDLWRSRTEGYKEVAHLFGNIMCPAEQIFSSMNQYFYNYGSSIQYWPLRYDGKQLIKRRNQNDYKIKQTDFVFTGSVTPYRASVIQSLRQKGFIVDEKPAHTPEYLRYCSINQSLFGIAPKHYPSTNLLSKMRVWWCLSNHFPLFVESVSETTDLDPFIMSYKNTTELLEYAQRFVHSDYESLVNRYKSWSTKQANPWLFLNENRLKIAA